MTRLIAATSMMLTLLAATHAHAQYSCANVVHNCYTEKMGCGMGKPPRPPGGGNPTPTPACTYCNDLGPIDIVATGQPCTLTMATTCASYTCDANQVCNANPINTGGTCTDDGNACTSDVCSGGACTHPANTAPCTDDSNPCTTDVCANSACTHPDNTNPCTDDGNPCTTDVCGGGACTHPTNGGLVCGQVCITNGGCCDNTECTAYNTANGTGVCSGVDGTCSTVCNANFRACGSTCIPSGDCCVASDCAAGGHVCNSPGTMCACPANTYDCNGTCISTSDCCTVPSNNCKQPTNGTATCPSNGGMCTLTCSSGFVACGGACATCCTDSDCKSAPTNEHGVCGSGGCSYQCNTGFKICGTTCIPSSQCCTSADCMNTTDPCHVQQGTCTPATGMCSYANNDGAMCNKDNSACTPNDTCSGGACVADTAHQVVCVGRDCQTSNGCVPATGQCSYTNMPDTTMCGNNGCNTNSGTCTNGACSATPKDCSMLNTDCLTGTCDASKPANTPCTTVNKPNSTVCGTTNKCVTSPMCSGGICGGATMTCTPSGACRESMCDPTSGTCQETVSATGTTCDASCQQNATCDANGTCNGDPVPDGTPCDETSCTIGSVCGAGACTCIGEADFGSSVIVPDGSDMGGSGSKHKGGCSYDTVGNHDSLPISALFLVLAGWLLRRKRAALS